MFTIFAYGMQITSIMFTILPQGNLLKCYLCSSLHNRTCVGQPTDAVTCPYFSDGCLKIITTDSKYDYRFPVPGGNNRVQKYMTKMFWGYETSRWKKRTTYAVVRKCRSNHTRFYYNIGCNSIKDPRYNITVCACTDTLCNMGSLFHSVLLLYPLLLIFNLRLV